MHDFSTPSTGDDPQDATLVFHEQSDGRKVARLPGGKVVLIDLKVVDRIGDGECWYVRLRHRDTFAIADPVERVTAATVESLGTHLTSPLAEALSRARVAPAVAPETPVAGNAPAADGGTQSAGESGVLVEARSVLPLAPPAATAAALDAAQPTAPIAPPPVDMSRLLRPSDRVALFVDGANMDFASRAAGCFIDYRRARQFFLGPATFYAAFYYVADFTATDPLQQRFFDFLSHNGYIVRRRPVKVWVDEDTGERVIKGNLDTEIVLDLLNTVDNYDVAFLFSGDSDFERAVDLLRSRGKRIYVVSSRGQIGKELAYVADKPIFFLEEHRDALARTDRAVRREAVESPSTTAES